jgi:hypothetical protein
MTALALPSILAAIAVSKIPDRYSYTKKLAVLETGK